MPTATDIQIEISRLPHSEGLELPFYASTEAAGMDICAAISENAPFILAQGASALVPSGFQMALPQGYEAQIRPRSGLAAKHGVSVLNSPGTIDSDYRGEVKVLLINHSTQDMHIERGMRIAQMIIAPVIKASWREVDALPDSIRGAGGFGSTGLTPEKHK